MAAVFHSSVGFGMENIDKDANEIQRLLLAEVKTLFPEWPEPKSVKCQKWRYSQVFNKFVEFTSFNHHFSIRNFTYA